MDYVAVSIRRTESEKWANLEAIQAVVKNDAEVVIVAEAKPECQNAMTTLGQFVLSRKG